MKRLIPFILTLFLGTHSIVGSAQVLTASHPSGFYTEAFDLKFEVPHGYSLFFSMDAQNPIKFGQPYTDQLIRIGDNDLLPPKIDTIPTTPLEGPWQLQYFKWLPPKPAKNDLWIVRATLTKDDSIISEQTLNYFIGDSWQSKHEFPIISLVTDSSNLFNSDSGLFVPGVNYSTDGWEDNFFGTGNYNMKGDLWQRPGFIQIFNQQFSPIYQSPIEYRIHGAVVGVFPQKSIRIYTDKSEGGTPLPLSIFNPSDSLELTRFILRNSGSDFISTHFRDAFLHSVAAKLNLDYQKSIPTVVYINGNYWGILNLRERIDRYYIESHHGVLKDNYDMIEGTGADVLEGSNEDYIQLLTAVYTTDLSIDCNYQKVVDQMDLSNYIDYTIFQTFFCNMDWPGNNVKFWKPKDGKWRWIFFDGDLMMSKYPYNKDGGASHNALEHATTNVNNEWYNSEGSTFLLRNLMKNASFRQQLTSRYAELSISVLKSSELLQQLDSFQKTYSAEMKRHIHRWSYPTSMDAWVLEVEKLKQFVIDRPSFYQSHLEQVK